MDSCLQELPLAKGNFYVPAKLNYWYNFSTFVLQSSLLLLKFGMSDIMKCYIICDGFHDSHNLSFFRAHSMVPKHYLQQDGEDGDGVKLGQGWGQLTRVKS